MGSAPAAFVHLFMLVALLACSPTFAVDFSWLSKLGQLITEQRTFPRTDLFSVVHRKRHYVKSQWLWEA